MAVVGVGVGHGQRGQACAQGGWGWVGWGEVGRAGAAGDGGGGGGFGGRRTQAAGLHAKTGDAAFSGTGAVRTVVNERRMGSPAQAGIARNEMILHLQHSAGRQARKQQGCDAGGGRAARPAAAWRAAHCCRCCRSVTRCHSASGQRLSPPCSPANPLRLQRVRLTCRPPWRTPRRWRRRTCASRTAPPSGRPGRRRTAALRAWCALPGPCRRVSSSPWKWGSSRQARSPEKRLGLTAVTRVVLAGLNAARLLHCRPNAAPRPLAAFRHWSQS